MRDFTRKISHGEMAFFLLPIIGVKLFEQIAGIAGTVVVNRLLCAEVITTISACRVYPMLQNNLIGAAATGFGIYVTRYIGKKDEEKLKEVAAAALMGAVALTVPGVGLLFLRNLLLDIIHVPAEIYGQAGEYLFWLFAGSGALVFQNLFLSMLYGMGESVFAGGVSVAGVGLQPLLTFLFVRYAGAGITAVPLASMVNRLILAAVLLGYLMWKYGELWEGTLRRQHCFGAEKRQKQKEYAEERRIGTVTSGTWRGLWGCGTSGVIMFLFVWCGTFAIQRQVNLMEASDISAYMYAVLVEDLLLVPIWACREGASYIMAQNAGAGNAALLRACFWRLNRLGWLFCLGIYVILWFWGPTVIRFVVGPAAGEITDRVQLWLRVCMPGFPALSMNQIGSASLQAVGAYRTMRVLGILEGALRLGLAAFVIAGAGFESLARAFLSIFLCMGISCGISCHVILNRRKESKQNAA